MTIDNYSLVGVSLVIEAGADKALYTFSTNFTRPTLGCSFEGYSNHPIKVIEVLSPHLTFIY